MKNKNKAGFTLVELLIVVAIVAILGAFAIPSYQNYIKNAKSAQGLAVLNSYKTIISQCITQNGNLKSCSGGQHQIPDNVTSRQSSRQKGIGIIQVTEGVIYSTIEFLEERHSTDTINQSYVVVHYTPVLNDSAINWVLSCSDFKFNSVIEGCSSEITP